MKNKHHPNEGALALTRLVRALAGMGLMAASLPAAFAQCTTSYTSTQTDTGLAPGACVNITAGKSGAWELLMTGDYSAGGNNLFTVNTKQAIRVDTTENYNGPITVTLHGPTTITSTSTLADSSLISASSDDPDMPARVIVNGDFTGTIGANTARAILAWGPGTSVTLNGASAITVQSDTSTDMGGALLAINGGAIVSHHSLTVRALQGAGPHSVPGAVAEGHGTIELRGHIDLVAASDSTGAIASGGTLTAVAGDSTSQIVGGGGVEVRQGGHATLSGIRVQSLAGDGIALSFQSSVLDAVDVTVDAQGAGLRVSEGRATFDGSRVSASNAIVTHGVGAHGVVATGRATGGTAEVNLARTSIVVNDDQASGVIAQDLAKVTLGEATGVEVKGSAQGVGLLAGTGGTIVAQGSAADPVRVRTTGARAHGLALRGGEVSLGQSAVRTTGDEAYGLLLTKGALSSTAGLSVTTQGHQAAAVVIDPAAAGDVTVAFDPDTTISAQGRDADGVSVRNAGSYAFDGKGLSLASIDVAQGALVAAQSGGRITVRDGARFAPPSGPRMARTGAEPLTWGAKANEGGTITLRDSVSTHGNGLWAAPGGTLEMHDTASAAGSVVRLDADPAASRVGRLDATAHRGALTLGYLHGAGALSLGENSLLLGGDPLAAGADTFSGMIDGTGSLTKRGTNTQVLSGPAALGFAGDAYLKAGVLALTQMGDTTALTKTFHISGGWLDLSGTSVPFDPSQPQSAASWGIRVVDDGGGGGVIGVNDNLVVTGGQTIAYQIGDAAAARGAGLYVIKQGAGTAQLTGENHYVGSTQIQGGTLQVTRDANLGDTRIAREIHLRGGALQLSAETPGTPSTFASARRVQLWNDARVTVDAGVTAILGSVAALNPDARLTKAGAGTLQFGAATLTGGLALEQGALTLNGGSLTDTSGAPAIAAAPGTSVTLSNVTLAGADVYALAAPGQGGRSVFSANAATLAGNVSADGAGSPTLLEARLSGGTHFSGQVNQRHGARVNLTLADASTTWRLSGDASVHDLANAGSLGFAQQPAASGAGPYFTLAVTGNYTGGGTLTLNTFLNTGGTPANSFTDRLLIAGDASGVTRLHVTPQGAGGNTNVRGDNQFHADEGMSLVQVGGAATMSAFQLDRPYVVAPGSIYQYRLFAYGPGSVYGVPAAGSTAQWDYRLQTAYEDQHGNIVPGVDPGGRRPLVLPQTSAYLVAPLALQHYGAMVLDSLHARLGEARRERAQHAPGGAASMVSGWVTGTGRGSPAGAAAGAQVFARVLAETGNYGSSLPWPRYGADYRQRSEALQFGGQLARFAFGERHRLGLDIAATVGSSTATPGAGATGASKLTVQAQSLALTASWSHLAGWYADLIVAGNFYRASVNGQTRDVGTLYGVGWDVSLGAGKRVALANGLQVEAGAQLTRQTVDLRDMTDKDGTSVALASSRAWTTQAGVRLAYPIEQLTSVWTPYVALGVSYTWLDGANAVLAGTPFEVGKVGPAARAAAGASGQLTPRLQIYGELNGQARLGHYGNAALGGRLGVRYRF